MNNEIKEILDFKEDADYKRLSVDEITILRDYITNLQEENERLNNKYNKALELLADYNLPCEYDEGKISNNYCEENCDVDDETYKKCWNKYIELELRGDSSNE